MMDITTYVPDSTALPQTGFEVPAELSSLLQQKGYTLTIPQSAGDLHAIARKHEHALAHFAPMIIRRKEIIFCLQAHDENDFFTFHMGSKGEPARNKLFHHTVGHRNKTAPDSIKEVGYVVAEHLLPLLRVHVEKFVHSEDNWF